MLRFLTRTGWCLLYAAGTIVVFLVIGLIAIAVDPEPISATVISDVMLIMAIMALRILGPSLLRYQPEPGQTSMSNRTWLLVIGTAALIFLGGQIMGVSLYEQIGSSQFDATVAERGAVDPRMVALLTLLVAPIAEELLLRGVAYPLLRRRVSVAAATATTTITFMVIHGNIVQGAAVMPLAILLALLYERTRSPWPGVIIHVGYNLAAVLVPTAFIAALATPIGALMSLMVCAVVLLGAHARLRREALREA